MQPDRPLDYYISRLFAQLDRSEFATEMEVQRAYRLLAGDLIYKLTPTVSFRNGILKLRFSAAALRHEMMMRREGLRQKLNVELHGDVVKKIVIV